MLEYINPDTWRTKELNSSVVMHLHQALQAERRVGPTSGAHEVYTSHEGLLLQLEESLTKPVPKINDQEFSRQLTELNDIKWKLTRSSKKKYYNSGAHMLWIGTRTKQLEGAHTEYFRGIDNPVGIKVGMDTESDFAVSLVRTIDPSNTPGKVVLISRFGSKNVSIGLPKLAEVTTQPAMWTKT